MATHFGWWNKDPEQGKYQVNVSVHGGNIAWTRKQGHHARWQPHTPTDDDRARLIYEAGKRVPRRLLSPKQFAEVKKLSEHAGPGALSGLRHRSSPEL